MPDTFNPPPQLPPPAAGLPAVPVTYTVAPPNWYGPDAEPEERPVPLSHYLWILKRHRWKIFWFVAACVLATFIVSERVTPIYESTATIDVDRRMPAGVLGQEANEYPGSDADQFLATQVKLIQSDSVLRPVVERYNLKAGDVAGELPSTRAQNAPVSLGQLKVTRPPNTYLLLISYRSPDADLASNVANAVASSYILHTYSIRFRSSASLAKFMEKQLDELKAKMEQSSAALAQFERELNVINPEEKTSILSARLLQLNTDYTNAQTDRVRKEAAYTSIRNGELEAAQVSTQGESLKRLTDKLEDAGEKFADIKAQYGAKHPEYRKAADQVAQIQQQLVAIRASIVRRVEIEYREAQRREAMLQKTVADTKAEYDALNARSFEYQSLKREADADKKLYEELTTKIKEAGINAGFQSSAIRMADSARPAIRPVFPNLPLNLGLAFLLSSLLAVGAAILSDVLDNTIRDPEQAQRLLGVEVVGSLPLVKDWKRKALAAARRKSGSTSLVKANSPVPALLLPDSRSSRSFEEAVRTLRNSILLGSFERPLKSILVTSATPGEGKTTTAVHLAIAHAQQKLKTLLIDVDLRRPGVARTFGLKPDAGLATILANGMQWREKLTQVADLPDLDILPTGPVSRRSVDLLGTGLPMILDEAEKDYDLIILDAPPLLGFPEPLQMATCVDGVVVVSLAGQTNRKAIGSVMATLQRLRANVVGLVLNEVTHEMSDSYYYYGYYGKHYKYYQGSSK
ncbi:MAG: polysaccharide biosynthesis tyrosine autokinase [Bryobacteraceae bacterium]